MASNEPTPTKFLVELIAAWIRDESLRCKILHKEIDGLKAFGLNDYQINALLSLDKDTILARLAMELEEFLEVDVAQVQSESGILIAPVPSPTGGTGGVGGAAGSSPQLLGSGAAGRSNRIATLAPGQIWRTVSALTSLGGSTVYNQGQVHLRGALPKMLTKGTDEFVTLRGQGFDGTTDVVFEQGTTQVSATVMNQSCDVDIYQRVIVKVKLDTGGAWNVKARNPGEAWSAEAITVIVN
jgi:hypothetical protein